MFEISKRLRYTVCVNENSAEGIGLTVGTVLVRDLLRHASCRFARKSSHRVRTNVYDCKRMRYGQILLVAKSNILSETDRKLS